VKEDKSERNFERVKFKFEVCGMMFSLGPEVTEMT
jgi:hypothetical protein